MQTHLELDNSSIMQIIEQFVQFLPAVIEFLTHFEAYGDLIYEQMAS